MKKLLIFSTLLLVNNTLFAQTYDYTAIVNSAEERNKPEEYIEYHDNGNIASKMFKDKNGDVNGKFTFYYESGNIQAKGQMVNNQMEGDAYIFEDQEAEKLISIITFKDGELISRKLLHENGKTKSITPLVNDKIEGVYYEYYEDGTLKSYKQFKNDMRNGTEKTYHKNGELKAIGSTVDGEAEGTWKYYYNNGSLGAEVVFKNGEVVSKKIYKKEEEEEEDFDIFEGVYTSSTSLSDESEKTMNSPKTIKVLQSHYMSEIKQMASYFGQDDTETYYFECYRDPNAGVLFFKTKYKKDKVYYNGRYYYDVLYEVQVLFKDINSVTQNGNKIYFNLNSNGFLRRAKPQGENWSDFVENNNDFEITIYNDEKRKDALNAFKYLVEHPYKND